MLFICWLEPATSHATSVILPVDCTGELAGDANQKRHQAATGNLHFPPCVSSFSSASLFFWSKTVDRDLHGYTSYLDT